MRLNKSLPNWSVPKIWVADGLSRASLIWIWSGANLAKLGANIAARLNEVTIRIPSISVIFFILYYPYPGPGPVVKQDPVPTPTSMLGLFSVSYSGIDEGIAYVSKEISQ